ncbi:MULTISPECIES: tyrosine-type recombinase/integrase [unclassified Ketobacter]|uniref:tyrosine-type recombinase/integrase n=1 Tax=unclassified Ketobacter TaxID=2639109 RepID=UPI000F1BBC58|nr:MULTISPECIES: tyrosine-type recombinase/integrase [unclassified Ketobacter]RLT87698.1 MAG: DUF4102 domain-containing protein [Ketobacter sp. GenoA1]RLT96637.1 MAG: DUF4102 domain-containing protein [Ketobacter sp.]
MPQKKYLKEKLTDLQVRQSSPKEKDYWLDDGGSLRLLVKANGTKCWRYNYRFQGKQKTFSIGIYPEVTLSQAREARRNAKQDIQNGIDPSQKKQTLKRQQTQSSENTFQALAKEWWSHQSGTWTPDHASRVWTRLRDNSFAIIGARAIEDISPQDIIYVIRQIEQRDALDVAKRVLQDINRVFRFAITSGRLKYNPASDLHDVRKKRKTTHRASLPKHELPEFLRALETYEQRGRRLTKLAIELLVLTFLRPGELRGARWEEFDFNQAIWRIPGSRMKMGTEHLVPLSQQALKILEQLKPISGKYDLVFPSERRRTHPMSDNTMRRAIFKLGYEGNDATKSKVTPHGFRATASSILNEVGFNRDAIERQLSHMERNGVRAAYTHHAEYLDERTRMMQWWADYLDDQRQLQKVSPIFSKQSAAK